MKSNEIELRFPLLIYGIGNPARQDDGLGFRLIEHLQSIVCSNRVDLVHQNQICIEDVLLILSYQTVIFVDASSKCDSSFTFERVFSQKSPFLYSHSVSVASLINICEELYQRSPACFMLEIQGCSWDFVWGLSSQAKKNFEEVLHFLEKMLWPEKDSSPVILRT